MHRRCLAFAGCAAAIVVFAAGCRGDANPAAAETLGPSPELPVVLDQASLLYHNSEGILLARPASGKEPRLVAKGGRYPRWLADGKHFVFIRGADVLLYDLRDESEHVLASPGKPIALATDVSGTDILFIDNKAVHRIYGPFAKGKKVRVETILKKRDFREIAVNGKRVVTTTGMPLRGYGVYFHKPPYGDGRLLGKGCSAGLSPDGKLATINLSGHTKLALVDPLTGEQRGVVEAPDGLKLDNQCWSNHPNWIAAVSEEDNRICIQRVSDGKVWGIVGPTGDRPSLFVSDR